MVCAECPRGVGKPAFESAGLLAGLRRFRPLPPRSGNSNGTCVKPVAIRPVLLASPLEPRASPTQPVLPVRSWSDCAGHWPVFALGRSQTGCNGKVHSRRATATKAAAGEAHSMEIERGFLAYTLSDLARAPLDGGGRITGR
jgi:hypothetical protein